MLCMSRGKTPSMLGRNSKRTSLHHRCQSPLLLYVDESCPRLSVMNKRDRDKFYRILAERDGEVCNICKTPASKKQLIVDHKNNNKRDNRLENLQLLCRKCNYLKNPRKKPVDFVCVSVCEERAPPPEMQANRRMEPLFRQWLFKKWMVNKSIRKDEAITAGAEHIGASTETTRRYVAKMTSSEGNYAIRKDALGYEYIHFKEQNP